VTRGPTEIAWTWSGETINVGMEHLGSDPTLLMLPALSSTSTHKEMWPIQMHLASAYATVSTDWPGFGDRPKPAVDWRPEAYAAYLDHLVTNVVPQPFATCAAGHAAAYVLAYAAAVPGSMGRLCLIAPARSASHHDRQAQGCV
jgi:pimeloyl-ACP methyl ester carboxylesterase